MCGRLNIIDDPLTQAISAVLGITFIPQTNLDLRPSQAVSVIGKTGYTIQQLELFWGIKPEWAKQMIINAQAESIASKPTFRAAYQNHRVVVPCSGWYEWKGDRGMKQKYLFSASENRSLFMAGIALEDEDRLVTLTTSPNPQCCEYHHRMPLLLSDEHIELWLHGSEGEANELLNLEYKQNLAIHLVT